MELNTRFRKAISVSALSAGMLLGGVGLAWAATVIGTSITLHPGAGIQTGTAAGNTALLQAYDVDGAAYTAFATLTANNTPTMDLAAGVTLGGSVIATLTGTETLTNKSLDADSNTVSNINGDELDSIAFSAGNYGVPIVLTVPVANTATVSVFNANAPFKFRVVDAWVQETVATNDGTWRLDDGTNNITSPTNFQTMDNAYGRVGWIDDAYHTISAGGTLRVQTDGTDSANIMIMIMRVD